MYRFYKNIVVSNLISVELRGPAPLFWPPLNKFEQKIDLTPIHIFFTFLSFGSLSYYHVCY